MTRENKVWCGLTIALSGALICPNAMAQPAIAESKKSIALPLSLTELEKMIGGRTILKLNLKDATLEEAAAAINASSGLKVQTPSNLAFQAPGIPAVPARLERRYSFEAKGEPFWEAFLAWQRAAIVAREAEPAEPDIVLTDGRTIRQPRSTALPLFGALQQKEGLRLQPGTPLAEGRTLVQWPYLMVGRQLTRTQQGNLAEVGLRPLDETGIRLAAVANPKPLAADPKLTSVEAKRWQDGLTLGARAYLDPKIKASGLKCEVEEAIDDKGNDLRPTPRDLLLAGSNSQSYSDVGAGTSINIAVHSQPNMGEKLVRLRGNLRFSVLIRSQHLELTDLANGGARNLYRDGNNFSVDFAGLSNVNGDWQAAFKCAGDGGIWNDFFGSQDFNVLLIDDAGQTFTSSYMIGGESIHFSMNTGGPIVVGGSPMAAAPNRNGFGGSAIRSFDQTRFGLRGLKIGRPVKLIVDLPIERREVVVPFEFTDLPLPPS